MLSRENDFSDPSADDFEALSRDRIPVRTMAETDLAAIIAIDRKITGRDRRAYYQGKLTEVLDDTGVRVSLVAEVDGVFAGFIMARVDYGDYGRAASTAVIDTVGVHPAFIRRQVGSALLSQLLRNLASLRVERVHTQVPWTSFDLLTFFHRSGFQQAQRLSFTKRL